MQFMHFKKSKSVQASSKSLSSPPLLFSFSVSYISRIPTCLQLHVSLFLCWDDKNINVMISDFWPSLSLSFSPFLSSHLLTDPMRLSGLPARRPRPQQDAAGVSRNVSHTYCHNMCEQQSKHVAWHGKSVTHSASFIPGLWPFFMYTLILNLSTDEHQCTEAEWLMLVCSYTYKSSDDC